jgi:hypothetical protein
MILKLKQKKLTKFTSILMIILMSLVLSLSFIIPLNSKFVSAVSGTLFESYTTGGDADSTAIYGQTYVGQTFTVGSISHTISNVIVNLKVTGTPGTITMIIESTTGGLPNDESIAITTVNGDLYSSTVYSPADFVLADPISVDAGTEYSIYFYVVGGSASDYITLKTDASSPAYTGGTYVESVTGGTSWAATAGTDCLFKVYGNGLADIVSVGVFNGYIDDPNSTDINVRLNDTLIVANIINTYSPYYPNQLASKYFSLQLLDTTGNIIIASDPVSGWGDGVSSIYIGENQTSQLQYGAAYKLRLMGTFSGAPTTITYTLKPEDWYGNNLTNLYQWCINTALKMGSYYSTSSSTISFVTQVSKNKLFGIIPSGSSYVLNQEGGAIFDNGIPGLSLVLPGLFQTFVGTIQYTQNSFTNSYQTGDNAIDTARWQENVGPTITTDATFLASFLQVDAKDLLVFFWIIVYALVAFWLINANQLAIALIGGFPWIMWGVYLGIVDVIVIGTIAAISALYIVWHFWWTRVV